MLVRRIAGAFLGAWLVAGCPGAEALSQAPADVERAEAHRVFNQRLGLYVAMRARLEEPLPAFDERRDPRSLMLTRRYLAAAIRTARAKAGQGDIFTPRVAAIFRVTVLENPIGGRGVLVDLVVNEPVPGWAMTKAPAALVAVLPVLPDAIEYCLVNGALILWDVHAEILIDWLEDQVPAD